MYIQLGAITLDNPSAPRTAEEEAWIEAQDLDALVEVEEGDASLVYRFGRDVHPPTLEAVLALLEDGHEVVCRTDWEVLAHLPPQVTIRKAYWIGEVILAADPDSPAAPHGI